MNWQITVQNVEGEIIMLTRFNELMDKVDRIGKTGLITHLTNIGFLTSPASTKHHGAVKHGLLMHSINVAEFMLELRQQINNRFNTDISEESCIIVGLFHDCGKAGYFGEAYYKDNILKGGERSKAKPYEHNNNLPAMTHEFMSLHIIGKFMQLSYEEVHAILYHNGRYTPTGAQLQGNELPLQQLLHACDIFESRFGNSRGDDTQYPKGVMF
jgi:23S rRNA maturation-related 3'-5' exoribonuclease YhaM